MYAASSDHQSLDTEARVLGSLLAAAKLRLPDNAPAALQASYKAYRGPRSFMPYFERKWLSLRLSALKRSMVVDPSVTPAFLQRICTTECPVTLQPLSIAGPDARKPTVDRLVNEVAYRAGNICMLSGRANHAKGELSFEQVLQIAMKAQTCRGLDASEWARLASLMYGAWAHAYKQADPYLIPLSTLPGDGLFMSTSQVVQLLLMRHFGPRGPSQQATGLWLGMTRASGADDELFLALRERLSAALQQACRPADAWSHPGVFEAFAQWYQICQSAVAPELESLLALHQERHGDSNAYANWQSNMRQ